MSDERDNEPERHDAALAETLPSVPTGFDWSAPTAISGAEEDQTIGLESMDSFERALAGEVVAGQYEVVRPLGAGGMGEVFVAKDTRLGRRVAIKTLKVSSGLTQGRRERFAQLFARDAASTAQLNHPNIVTIHSFGDHEGTPFFVLELVDGKPLDELLHEHGPLSERDVLELGVQLCDALSYAHARGIIHRDIKPANLMRSDDGHLKVLDFGIALIRKAKEELEDAFGDSSDDLTARIGEEPQTAGTPAYMAPEQRVGAQQDARVDVWAAGVTLYELLVGDRPFSSIIEITQGQPVAWPDDVTVSPATRRALARCLLPEPGARTPSMRALGAELGRALELLTRPSTEYPEAPRTNLAKSMDTFVGRGEDLERLSEEVLGRKTALVTLVGPGGVGKTRLVSEFGWKALDDPSVDSILMCALTEARTMDGVLSALGSALGVPLTAKDPVQQLSWVLQGRPGLVLILDNCEQVTDHVAELCMGWSGANHSVRVVVTSRVTLDVSGERVVELGPMRDAGQAMDLYTARARKVRSGWTCPDEQLAALEELVDELDRLPLAIELAAARVKVLSPAKMLARMSRRFDVLKGSKRDRTDRQATLRGAIAWSWDLLDEAQRSAMAQLSVFQGGFTLEDAEENCDLAHIEGDEEPFVLDVVEHLVGASLLRTEGSGERFSMLVSISAYASERLDDLGLGDAARARHARWLASQWGPIEVERARSLGSATLRDAADDLEAASAWALGPGRSAEEVEWGMSCTAALGAVVESRGPFHLVDGLLARLGPHRGLETAGAARATGRLGRVRRIMGHRVEARALLSRALEISEALGDEGARATWLAALAVVSFYEHDDDEARRQHREALELQRARKNRQGEGVNLGDLGVVELRAKNFALAQQLLEEALEIAEELGDRRNEAVWLGNLAQCMEESGQIERAREHYERAVSIARVIGNQSLQRINLSNLGYLEGQQDNTARAMQLYERAGSIARALGDSRGEGIVLGSMGLVEQRMGHVPRARELFERALAIAQQVDDHENAGFWEKCLKSLHGSR